VFSVTIILLLYT